MTGKTRGRPRGRPRGSGRGGRSRAAQTAGRTSYSPPGSPESRFRNTSTISTPDLDLHHMSMSHKEFPPTMHCSGGQGQSAHGYSSGDSFQPYRNSHAEADSVTTVSTGTQATWQQANALRYNPLTPGHTGHSGQGQQHGPNQCSQPQMTFTGNGDAVPYRSSHDEHCPSKSKCEQRCAYSPTPSFRQQSRERDKICTFNQGQTTPSYQHQVFAQESRDSIRNQGQLSNGGEFGGRMHDRNGSNERAHYPSHPAVQSHGSRPPVDSAYVPDSRIQGELTSGSSSFGLTICGASKNQQSASFLQKPHRAENIPNNSSVHINKSNITTPPYMQPTCHAQGASQHVQERVKNPGACLGRLDDSEWCSRRPHKPSMTHSIANHRAPGPAWPVDTEGGQPCHACHSEACGRSPGHTPSYPESNSSCLGYATSGACATFSGHSKPSAVYSSSRRGSTELDSQHSDARHVSSKHTACEPFVSPKRSHAEHPENKRPSYVHSKMHPDSYTPRDECNMHARKHSSPERPREQYRIAQGAPTRQNEKATMSYTHVGDQQPRRSTATGGKRGARSKTGDQNRGQDYSQFRIPRQNAGQSLHHHHQQGVDNPPSPLRVHSPVATSLKHQPSPQSVLHQAYPPRPLTPPPSTISSRPLSPQRNPNLDGYVGRERVSTIHNSPCTESVSTMQYPQPMFTNKTSQESRKKNSDRHMAPGISSFPPSPAAVYDHHQQQRQYNSHMLQQHQERQQQQLESNVYQTPSRVEISVQSNCTAGSCASQFSPMKLVTRPHQGQNTNRHQDITHLNMSAMEGSTVPPSLDHHHPLMLSRQGFECDSYPSRRRSFDNQTQAQSSASLEYHVVSNLTLQVAPVNAAKHLPHSSMYSSIDASRTHSSQLVHANISRDVVYEQRSSSKQSSSDYNALAHAPAYDSNIQLINSNCNLSQDIRDKTNPNSLTQDQTRAQGNFQLHASDFTRSQHLSQQSSIRVQHPPHDLHLGHLYRHHSSDDLTRKDICTDPSYSVNHCRKEQSSQLCSLDSSREQISQLSTFDSAIAQLPALDFSIGQHGIRDQTSHLSTFDSSRGQVCTRGQPSQLNTLDSARGQVCTRGQPSQLPVLDSVRGQEHLTTLNTTGHSPYELVPVGRSIAGTAQVISMSNIDESHKRLHMPSQQTLQTSVDETISFQSTSYPERNTGFLTQTESGGDVTKYVYKRFERDHTRPDQSLNTSFVPNLRQVCPPWQSSSNTNRDLVASQHIPELSRGQLFPIQNNSENSFVGQMSLAKNSVETIQGQQMYPPLQSVSSTQEEQAVSQYDSQELIIVEPYFALTTPTSSITNNTPDNMSVAPNKQNMPDMSTNHNNWRSMEHSFPNSGVNHTHTSDQLSFKCNMEQPRASESIPHASNLSDHISRASGSSDHVSQASGLCLDGPRFESLAAEHQVFILEPAGTVSQLGLSANAILQPMSESTQSENRWSWHTPERSAGTSSSSSFEEILGNATIIDLSTEIDELEDDAFRPATPEVDATVKEMKTTHINILQNSDIAKSDEAHGIRIASVFSLATSRRQRRALSDSVLQAKDSIVFKQPLAFNTISGVPAAVNNIEDNEQTVAFNSILDAAVALTMGSSGLSDIDGEDLKPTNLQDNCEGIETSNSEVHTTNYRNQSPDPLAELQKFIFMDAASPAMEDWVLKEASGISFEADAETVPVPFAVSRVEPDRLGTPMPVYTKDPGTPFQNFSKDHSVPLSHYVKNPSSSLAAYNSSKRHTIPVTKILASPMSPKQVVPRSNGPADANDSDTPIEQNEVADEHETAANSLLEYIRNEKAQAADAHKESLNLVTKECVVMLHRELFPTVSTAPSAGHVTAISTSTALNPSVCSKDSSKLKKQELSNTHIDQQSKKGIEVSKDPGDIKMKVKENWERLCSEGNSSKKSSSHKIVKNNVDDKDKDKNKEGRSLPLMSEAKDSKKLSHKLGCDITAADSDDKKCCGVRGRPPKMSAGRRQSLMHRTSPFQEVDRPSPFQERLSSSQEEDRLSLVQEIDKPYPVQEHSSNKDFQHSLNSIENIAEASSTQIASKHEVNEYTKDSKHEGSNINIPCSIDIQEGDDSAFFPELSPNSSRGSTCSDDLEANDEKLQKKVRSLRTLSQDSSEEEFGETIADTILPTIFPPSRRHGKSEIASAELLATFHDHKLKCVELEGQHYVVLEELLAKCFPGLPRAQVERARLRDLNLLTRTLHILDSDLGEDSLSVLALADAARLLHFFHGMMPCPGKDCALTPSKTRGIANIESKSASDHTLSFSLESSRHNSLQNQKTCLNNPRCKSYAGQNDYHIDIDIDADDDNVADLNSINANHEEKKFGKCNADIKLKDSVVGGNNVAADLGDVEVDKGNCSAEEAEEDALSSSSEKTLPYSDGQPLLTWDDEMPMGQGHLQSAYNRTSNPFSPPLPAKQKTRKHSFDVDLEMPKLRDKDAAFSKYLSHQSPESFRSYHPEAGEASPMLPSIPTYLSSPYTPGSICHMSMENERVLLECFSAPGSMAPSSVRSAPSVRLLSPDRSEMPIFDEDVFEGLSNNKPGCEVDLHYEPHGKELISSGLPAKVSQADDFEENQLPRKADSITFAKSLTPEMASIEYNARIEVENISKNLEKDLQHFKNNNKNTLKNIPLWNSGRHKEPILETNFLLMQDMENKDDRHFSSSVFDTVDMMEKAKDKRHRKTDTQQNKNTHFLVSDFDQLEASDTLTSCKKRHSDPDTLKARPYKRDTEKDIKLARDINRRLREIIFDNKHENRNKTDLETSEKYTNESARSKNSRKEKKGKSYQQGSSLSSGKISPATALSVDRRDFKHKKSTSSKYTIKAKVVSSNSAKSSSTKNKGVLKTKIPQQKLPMRVRTRKSSEATIMYGASDDELDLNMSSSNMEMSGGDSDSHFDMAENTSSERRGPISQVRKPQETGKIQNAGCYSKDNTESPRISKLRDIAKMEEQHIESLDHSFDSADDVFSVSDSNILSEHECVPVSERNVVSEHEHVPTHKSVQDFILQSNEFASKMAGIVRSHSVPTLSSSGDHAANIPRSEASREEAQTVTRNLITMRSNSYPGEPSTSWTSATANHHEPSGPHAPLLRRFSDISECSLSPARLEEVSQLAPPLSPCPNLPKAGKDAVLDTYDSYMPTSFGIRSNAAGSLISAKMFSPNSDIRTSKSNEDGVLAHPHRQINPSKDRNEPLENNDEFSSLASNGDSVSETVNDDFVITARKMLRASPRFIAGLKTPERPYDWTMPCALHGEACCSCEGMDVETLQYEAAASPRIGPWLCTPGDDFPRTPLCIEEKNVSSPFPVPSRTKYVASPEQKYDFSPSTPRDPSGIIALDNLQDARISKSATSDSMQMSDNNISKNQASTSLPGPSDNASTSTVALNFDNVPVSQTCISILSDPLQSTAMNVSADLNQNKFMKSSTVPENVSRACSSIASKPSASTQHPSHHLPAVEPQYPTINSPVLPADKTNNVTFVAAVEYPPPNLSVPYSPSQPLTLMKSPHETTSTSSDDIPNKILIEMDNAGSGVKRVASLEDWPVAKRRINFSQEKSNSECISHCQGNFTDSHNAMHKEDPELETSIGSNINNSQQVMETETNVSEDESCLLLEVNNIPDNTPTITTNRKVPQTDDISSTSSNSLSQIADIKTAMLIEASELKPIDDKNTNLTNREMKPSLALQDRDIIQMAQGMFENVTYSSESSKREFRRVRTGSMPSNKVCRSKVELKRSHSCDLELPTAKRSRHDAGTKDRVKKSTVDTKPNLQHVQTIVSFAHQPSSPLREANEEYFDTGPPAPIHESLNTQLQQGKHESQENSLLLPMMDTTAEANGPGVKINPDRAITMETITSSIMRESELDAIRVEPKMVSANEYRQAQDVGAISYCNRRDEHWGEGCNQLASSPMDEGSDEHREAVAVNSHSLSTVTKQHHEKSDTFADAAMNVESGCTITLLNDQLHSDPIMANTAQMQCNAENANVCTQYGKRTQDTDFMNKMDSRDLTTKNGIASDVPTLDSIAGLNEEQDNTLMKDSCAVQDELIFSDRVARQNTESPMFNISFSLGDVISNSQKTIPENEPTEPSLLTEDRIACSNRRCLDVNSVPVTSFADCTAPTKIKNERDCEDNDGSNEALLKSTCASDKQVLTPSELSSPGSVTSDKLQTLRVLNVGGVHLMTSESHTSCNEIVHTAASVSEMINDSNHEYLNPAQIFSIQTTEPSPDVSPKLLTKNSFCSDSVSDEISTTRFNTLSSPAPCILHPSLTIECNTPSVDILVKYNTQTIDTTLECNKTANNTKLECSTLTAATSPECSTLHVDSKVVCSTPHIDMRLDCNTPLKDDTLEYNRSSPPVMSTTCNIPSITTSECEQRTTENDMEVEGQVKQVYTLVEMTQLNTQNVSLVMSSPSGTECLEQQKEHVAAEHIEHRHVSVKTEQISRHELINSFSSSEAGELGYPWKNELLGSCGQTGQLDKESESKRPYIMATTAHSNCHTGPQLSFGETKLSDLSPATESQYLSSETRLLDLQPELQPQCLPAETRLSDFQSEPKPQCLSGEISLPDLQVEPGETRLSSFQPESKAQCLSGEVRLSDLQAETGETRLSEFHPESKPQCLSGEVRLLDLQAEPSETRLSEFHPESKPRCLSGVTDLQTETNPQCRFSKDGRLDHPTCASDETNQIVSNNEPQQLRNSLRTGNMVVAKKTDGTNNASNTFTESRDVTLSSDILYKVTPYEHGQNLAICDNGQNATNEDVQKVIPYEHGQKATTYESGHKATHVGVQRAASFEPGQKDTTCESGQKATTYESGQKAAHMGVQNATSYEPGQKDTTCESGQTVTQSEAGQKTTFEAGWLDKTDTCSHFMASKDTGQARTSCERQQQGANLAEVQDPVEERLRAKDAVIQDFQRRTSDLERAVQDLLLELREMKKKQQELEEKKKV